MDPYHSNAMAQGATPMEAFQMQRWGGFWRRWAAYIVDNLVTFLFSLPIGIVLWYFLHPRMDIDHHAFYATPTAIYFVVGTIYGGILIGSPRMGTWGRSAAGLAIVDARDGQGVKGARSYLRAFLSALFVLFWPVELLQLVTRRRQSLADLICGTVVVRTHERNRLFIVAVLLTIIALLASAALFVSGVGSDAGGDDGPHESNQSGEV